MEKKPTLKEETAEVIYCGRQNYEGDGVIAGKIINLIISRLIPLEDKGAQKVIDLLKEEK